MFLWRNIEIILNNLCYSSLLATLNISLNYQQNFISISFISQLLFCSDHKLAKKNDKKDLRKQRRRERLEEKDDLAEGADKAPRHPVHFAEVVDMSDVEGI